jgi:hypothetical protein
MMLWTKIKCRPNICRTVNEPLFCGLCNDAVNNPDFIMSMLGWLVNDKFKRDLVGNFVA